MRATNGLVGSLTGQIVEGRPATGKLPTRGLLSRNNFRIARQPDGNTMRRLQAGLPSMIVIPVGDEVLMALVSLKPAAL